MILIQPQQGPAPNDMRVISEMARLAGFLPALQIEVQKMEATVDSKVFALIRDGALTPEYALNAWLEKNSYRTLLRRFETRVRVGASVGAAQGHNLDITA